jgi:hypothetical protein
MLEGTEKFGELGMNKTIKTIPWKLARERFQTLRPISHEYRR